MTVSPSLARLEAQTSPSTAQTSVARARSAAEIAAYRALNASRMEEAETRFEAILATDPGDSQALAGMGYVRMQQGNFLGAISFIEQARRNNPADKGLAEALETSRFWFIMSEGQQALSDNDLATAEKRYRSALVLRPDSADALNGLGGTLQKAVTEQTDAGQKPSPAIEMELAHFYADQGSPQLAYPIYQQVLRENPGRADAWAGLLSALHLTGHDKEVVDQLKLIPQSARTQLETNASYLQTMAAVYGALGRSREATMFPGPVEQGYAAQRSAPPADMQIQNAWLLYNGMDDAGLYRELTSLGGRTDLTEEQQRTLQAIWTNWAVRRANQAAAVGNPRTALAILNAAARAFPDNPVAIEALAIGYSEVGQPHLAVQIYKTQNMASGSAANYEAAVGAALADGDNKDAEIWLRYALAAYPADPQILILGAKFEQARGDTARAMKYYRASLKAMPPAAVGTRLPAESGATAAPNPLNLPSADQPQPLSVLLGPGGGDFTSPASVPSEPALPRFGSQAPLPPYDGGSRVVPPYMINPGGEGDRSGSNDQADQARTTPKAASPTGQAEADSTMRSVTNQAPTQAEPVAAPASGQTDAQAATPSQASGSSADVSRSDVVSVAPPVPVATNTDRRTGPTTAVPVQLGSNTSHPEPQQAEVTDVLPTVRYAPSARADRAAAAQPDVEAARAARIRRLQADSAAGKTGQSQPPSEQPITAPTSEPVLPPPPAPPVSTPPVATNPALPAAGAGPFNPPVRPVYPLPPPPTDAELRARNLPSLRGYFEAQAPLPQTPRQQAESELAALEGSYSGWIGATGIGRYRSGTAGLDRLYDVESPVEASAVIGKSVRLTTIAEPVFLNSGVLSASSFGTTNVPYIGTLPGNSANAPAQQFSNGMGGELQLAAKNIGLAVGYTPYEFLVRNVTARFSWSAPGSYVSLFGERQPVKDTQLSYAGLYDPGASSTVLQRPVWGGVVSTTGGARLEFASGNSSFYVSGDGGILTGQHVLDNSRFEGTAGATFLVRNWTGVGKLTIGGALSGLHYAHNEVGLSYGQGGYFSPDSYFLASVPVTFNGHFGPNFHTIVVGALGVQTFRQNEAPFYPLDPSLQSSFVPPSGVTCSATQAPSINCGEYPATVTTSFSYATHAQASYRFAEHWFGGGFVLANNANNYNTVSAGFFLRYVFRAQHSPEDYPAGLFPVDGLHPLQIP